MYNHYFTLVPDPKQNLANSIDARYRNRVKREDTQKEEVFRAIKALGKANDRMIKEYLGYEYNVIPDRRGRLLKEHRIIKLYKEKDLVTGVMTTFYKASEE